MRVVATLILTILLVAGCAQLTVPEQRPEVHLVDVIPLTSPGLAPRFLVRLQVVNRSRRALNVSGLTYDLALNGARVMSGVTAEAVSVAPFGRSLVDVDASVNLIGSLRTVTGWLAAPADVEYELETTLHNRWWPVPITVVDRGVLVGGNAAAPR